MSDAKSEDELLALVCAISNGWYVSAQNLVFAGKLVEKGLARAEDDCEGPQLVPTEKGIQSALRRKLIEPSAPDSYWSKYQKVRS